MRILIYILAIVGFFGGNFKICLAKEVKLSSKNFQKQFLQTITESMETTAKLYLNNFLKDIKKPTPVQGNFDHEHKLALNSNRLEPKIVFIKQYLDMEEHKDTSRDNMYGLRNVNFLHRLNKNFHQLQEESFEETHQLRYFYLCKKFKVQKEATTPPYHNYYSRSAQMAPINELNVGAILNNHTISINISDFGNELYRKVNDAGADIINDYLIIIRKLLQEVLELQIDEENTPNSEALRKILIEIDALLNTNDFYAKRQRLYDYLQNHLALDYEQFQNSTTSQQVLTDIFEKLKEEGLDLIVAYLFSNFEFIDYLHDQWVLQLPKAPISLFDERSRPLKLIQQLYTEFQQDFENSAKYESYLQAVKLLHEQTRQENADNTHIYEMLYSASQNVGSSRATLMNSKCNEI